MALDFITFLCHHIAHIGNQRVTLFDWVTHWRSLQKDATTKCKHKTQALMGATRPASGTKEKAHTPNKGSQTVLITLMSVSLCLNARRGTRRPH